MGPIRHFLSQNYALFAQSLLSYRHLPSAPAREENIKQMEFIDGVVVPTRLLFRFAFGNKTEKECVGLLISRRSQVGRR